MKCDKCKKEFEEKEIIYQVEPLRIYEGTIHGLPWNQQQILCKKCMKGL